MLRRQLPDGSWSEGRWGTLPNTCLALLFLRKANLAFELDRVLKLPGASRPRAPAGPAAAPEAAPKNEPRSELEAAHQDEANVIVTGTSDTNFPEIAVEFEVKRADGTFLLDAKADVFRVTEDGREERILRFLTA